MVTDAGVAEQVAAGDFPDEVHLTQGLVLPLSYAFSPGDDEDGVTVDVPLGVLDTVAEQTSGASLAWTVPGQREELVTALLRGLPKQLRRGLVPIPDRVREVLPHIVPDRAPAAGPGAGDPPGGGGAGPAGRVVARRASPTTSGPRSGCSTTGTDRWPPARTWPRCAGRWPGSPGGRWPGPRRTCPGPG